MKDNFNNDHINYEDLITALNIAEKSYKHYRMISIYDYGSFYYFSCKRKKDNQEGNGPCIDKKTLKEISINSADLILLPCEKIIDVNDLKEEIKKKK